MLVGDRAMLGEAQFDCRDFKDPWRLVEAHVRVDRQSVFMSLSG